MPSKLIVLILGTIFILSGCSTRPYQPSAKIIDSIQGATVLVNTQADYNEREGTGVLFKNKANVYVLTAAHVLATEDWVIDTGANKVAYKKYVNPTIRRFVLKDHTIITSLEYDVEILKIDTDYDIALLRVVKPDFAVPKITFKVENPPLISRVLICGNMAGSRYPLSISDGTIGAYSRSMSGNKFLLNQLNASIIAGCSGGGAYEESSGKFIGMVVMGACPNETCFAYYIPSEAILAWIDANGLGFILDENKKDTAIKIDNIISDSVKIIPTTQKIK